MSHKLRFALGGLLITMLPALAGFSLSGGAAELPHPPAPYQAPDWSSGWLIQADGPAVDAAIAVRQAEEARIAAEVEAARVAEEQRLAEEAAEARRIANQKAAAPKTVAVVAPPSSNCYGVNSYAASIYNLESGCNPGNTSTSGCRGVGQACPGSKLPCSDEDAACQLAWFESYALGRYGSWEAAYAHKVAYGWW